MKKILLIEDNKDVRENTAEILELSNYQVFTAENGKRGVELAIKEKPDLIICDIMMPVLDGYGTLYLLSKNKDTASIPFIFLTAKTEKGEIRKGMEMGADDYVTKPFDDIELLNAVETRLKKAEILRRDFDATVHGLNEFITQARKAHQLNLLSEDHDVLHYNKKTIIYQQGNRAVNLFFIGKGKVKIFKTSVEGKDLILDVLKEGDFFGYTALLEELPYRDNAETLEESEIMLIPGNEFLELINSDFTIAGKFIKMLANNLSEREEKLVSLAYNSVRKRVADGLLKIYEHYRKSKVDNFGLQITREDLAQIAGIATESLIRTLRDFKDERLIEIKEGKIMIINEAKLKILAS